MIIKFPKIRPLSSLLQEAREVQLPSLTKVRMLFQLCFHLLPASDKKRMVEMPKMLFPLIKPQRNLNKSL